MAFIVRDTVFNHPTVTASFPFSLSSFELAQLTVTSLQLVHFFCLYSPPPSKKNRLTESAFFSDFVVFGNTAISLEVKCLLLGILISASIARATLTPYIWTRYRPFVSLRQLVYLLTPVETPSTLWFIGTKILFFARSVSVCHSLSSDHLPVMRSLDISKPESTQCYGQRGISVR